MRISRTLIAGGLLIAAWPATAVAQGYQVQPMLTTIAPSGPKARVSMIIKNSGAVPISLEMTPFRATVNEAGAATRVDEEKVVLVYPAQTSIDPGKEQTVQIRYIGDPALTEARMYGVRVSQLPVSAPGMATATSSSGAATDVKVSFNFLSHIIVSPEDAKAVLAVEDVGRAPNGDLMLRITNSGAGIAVLTASDVRLTDAAGKRSELKPEDFKIGDFSAFMPRQTRRATIAAKDLTGLTGPIKPVLTVQ